MARQRGRSRFFTAEVSAGKLETPRRNQPTNGQPAKTMKVGRLKVARAQMAPMERMLDQSMLGLSSLGMRVRTSRREVKANSRLFASGLVAYTHIRWLEASSKSGVLGELRRWLASRNTEKSVRREMTNRGSRAVTWSRAGVNILPARRGCRRRSRRWRRRAGRA